MLPLGNPNLQLISSNETVDSMELRRVRVSYTAIRTLVKGGGVDIRIP